MSTGPQLRFLMATDTTPARLDILGPIGGPEWAGGVTPKAVNALLSGLGDEDPVHVQINSPGGYSDDGVAIYSLLRAHRGPVSIDVIGGAHSAASVIAMAADPGKLRVAEGGGMLVHEAWGLAIGNADDMLSTAKMLDTTSEGIAKIYSRRTGLTVQEARDLMKADTLLGSDDALAQGFVDALIEADELDEDAEEMTAKAFRDWQERIRAGATQKFMAARTPAPQENRMSTIKLAALALALGSTATSEDDLLQEVHSLKERPSKAAFEDVVGQRDNLLGRIASLEAEEESRLLGKWVAELRFDVHEAYGDGSPESLDSSALARQLLASAPGDTLAARAAFVEKVRPARADLQRMSGEGVDTQEHREDIVPDPGESRKRIEARAQEIAESDGRKLFSLSDYRKATAEAAKTDPEATREINRPITQEA